MRGDERTWRLDLLRLSRIRGSAAANRRSILAVALFCVSLVACQALRASESWNSAISLSEFTLAAPGSQIIQHPDYVEIVTSPQKWAYAATISLEDLAALPGPMVFSIKARATEGALAFGLLNHDETAFLTEIVLPKSGKPVTVELGIPALAGASRLMVRNAEQEASSRGVVFEIVMRSGVTGSRSKEIKLMKALEAKYPILSDPAATDWQKVSALRSWVYEVTDLAGSSTTLLPNVYRIATVSVAETVESLEKNEGGLLCDGAAWVLRHVLTEFGYHSTRVLGYGTPTAVTHSVLLADLQVGGELKTVILDPFFNIAYVDEAGDPLDFFDILGFLRHKQADRVRVEDHSNTLKKDVIISSADGSYTDWAAAHSGFTSLSSCDTLTANFFRCRLRPNLLGFSERHALVPDTHAFLKSHGYSEDLRYLLLFPFAVSDDRGYRDDPADSTFLCRAQMASKNLKQSEAACELQ